LVAKHLNESFQLKKVFLERFVIQIHLEKYPIH
jgi:hypothetical protein